MFSVKFKILAAHDILIENVKIPVFRMNIVLRYLHLAFGIKPT